MEGVPAALTAPISAAEEDSAGAGALDREPAEAEDSNSGSGDDKGRAGTGH